MQIRKSKKVSSGSSKADRFLNFLISFLTLAVLVGMGLLLHISFVAAQTPDPQTPIVAAPMVDAQEMVTQSEPIPMEGAPLVFGLSNGLELFSLENIDRSSQSLNAVLKDLGNFPRHVHNALERARPDTSVSWVWLIFALTLFADKLFARRLLRFYRGRRRAGPRRLDFCSQDHWCKLLPISIDKLLGALFRRLSRVRRRPAIREIFNREGITFAHREVKVRIDEGAAGGQTFSDSQKKAVGGAVLPVVEEDDQNGSPKA